MNSLHNVTPQFEYIVIETDAGLTVARQPVGGDAAATAVSNGGMLVDPGPYRSQEEAYEALADIPLDAEEERD